MTAPDREPVPAAVRDAARVVYVRARGLVPADAERDAAEAIVTEWVASRYPARHPADPAGCAFWVLSLAADVGVSGRRE